MKNQMKRTLSDRRGSTLLECLAALLIFTLVMTMTATMFASSSTISNRSTDLSRSVNSAVNTAEINLELPGESKGTQTLTFRETDASGSTVTVSIEFTSTVSGGVTLWRFLPPNP